MNSSQSVTIRVVNAFGAIFLIVFVFYVVTNVIARYAGFPLLGMVEISTRWMMVPMVFAGIAVAEYTKDHLTVDFLADLMPAWIVPIVRWFGSMMTFLFMVFVIYYGWLAANNAFGRGEYAIDSGVAVWPSRYLVPLFGIIFLWAGFAAWRDKRRTRSANGSRALVETDRDNIDMADGKETQS